MNPITHGPWSVDVSHYPDATGDPVYQVVAPYTGEDAEPGETIEVAGNLAQADAHLIAAAPDMLKAMSDLLDLIDGRSCEVKTLDVTAFRNAVLKAKGGAA